MPNPADAELLAATTLRLVPDATPERLAALLACALTVERLAAARLEFSVERTDDKRNPERDSIWEVSLYDSAVPVKYGATLPEAVDAALKEARGSDAP